MLRFVIKLKRICLRIIHFYTNSNGLSHFGVLCSPVMSRIWRTSYLSWHSFHPKSRWRILSLPHQLYRFLMFVYSCLWYTLPPFTTRSYWSNNPLDVLQMMKISLKKRMWSMTNIRLVQQNTTSNLFNLFYTTIIFSKTKRPR